MRDRYLNTVGLASAKVPSILYYDHDSNFCGVENGVDFQDDDAYLKMRRRETMTRPPMHAADDSLGGSC